MSDDINRSLEGVDQGAMCRESAHRADDDVSDKLIASQMLIVKNVPPGTTANQLKDVFADAKNIVVEFPRESSLSSSATNSWKKDDGRTMAVLPATTRIEG